MTVIDAQALPSGIRQIPQPEPGLTGQDLIERARALRDRLRAEQADTEQRTRYSEDLHEEIVRLGFFRILQPTVFGGYELPITDFLRVISELAQGCASTAWSVALGASHVIGFAGTFAPDVQAEVMGEDGHFIAPNRAVPSVLATPVDGGWELNGTWDYSSGVPYATHVVSAVSIAPGEDGTPGIGLAVVPRDQYTILDDWGTLIGLRGSGSNSVRLEKAFVPEGYVVAVNPATFEPATPYGVALHGNPIFTGRVQPFFWAELHALGLGMVRAMLEEYRAVMPTKRTMWPPLALRKDDPDFQYWYGRASTLADAAEAIIFGVGDRFTELVQSAERQGGTNPAEELRLVAQANHAGDMLAEAMDLLVRTGGSSFLRDGTRTQRYWRDFSMFRSHVSQTMKEFATRQSAVVELAQQP